MKEFFRLFSGGTYIYVPKSDQAKFERAYSAGDKIFSVDKLYVKDSIRLTCIGKAVINIGSIAWYLPKLIEFDVAHTGDIH